MSMWVVSSFEDSHSKNVIKHKDNGDNAGALKRYNGKCEIVWSEKFRPKKLVDLAVNTRKVQEVHAWLSDALDGKLGRAPVAVFSGPSGSGKTTTLRLLAKTMPFVLKEWVSPSCYQTTRFDEDGVEQRCFPEDGQLKKFEDFLFHASRYCSLFEDPLSRRQVLLVEDIPNVFIHDPVILDNTIRKYLEIGLSPLIFICSSGSNEFNLERLLFKSKKQNELGLTHISFNPINRTLMIRAIERIIELGKKDSDFTLTNATKELIEHIADASGSDIRFAVNQMQFGCFDEKGASRALVKNTKLLKKSKQRVGGRKKPSKSYMPEKGKDHFIDVFRCVGRVLYCKKEEVPNNTTKGMELKLCHDPNEIVNQMYSSPKLFQDLLSENYVGVFSDIKSISEAALCLSQSDIILSQLNDTNKNTYYGLSISVLGLMNYSNGNVNRKWNPFRGSKCKERSSSLNERKKLCKELLGEEILDIGTCMMEILPYYAEINSSKLTEGENNLSELKPSKFYNLSK